LNARKKSFWFRLTTALCLAAISLSLLEPLAANNTVFAMEDSAELELYVSPDGDDDNNGSISAPFRTLLKARDTVRGLNDNMGGDIVVYLRGGEYAMPEKLIFNEEDSGSNGYNVVYRNYPGETPVITGGQRIEGWVEENGMLKADATGLKFRDLWVNGQRAVRARSEAFKIASWDESARLIHVPLAAVSAWGDTLDPQLEIVVVQHWVRFYSRLDSFDRQSERVSLALIPDARDKVFNAQYPDKAANQSFHFENSLAYLDEPGEWLLDEANGVVYYIPLEGEDVNTLNAQFGTTETFIDFKGMNKDNRVTNMKLSGITFQYTKYQYPLDVNHVVPGQAGLADGVYGGSKRQPAAIQLEAADHIVLERNIIRHAGATAIDIRGSSRNNEVVGNAILDIGGSGISEGWFSEPGAATTDPTRMTEGNVIRNNYLNGISLTSCGVGIVSGYIRGVLIEHNEVANADYSGISVGWGWTANATSLQNNVIRNNNIHGVMKRLADGAAIYTLSRTPDSEISGNYIHDIDSSEFASNYPVASIYLDQATWGYKIFNNVFRRVGHTFNFNMLEEGGNQLYDNESQNAAIIASAGLQPEYWDIVPGANMHHEGETLTATAFGSYWISGSVEGTDAVSASIKKNDEVIWSSATGGGGLAYTLAVDVRPGDEITFHADGDVAWHSLVKPESYTPRLTIESVQFEGLQEGRTKFDHLNKVVTVITQPDVDMSRIEPIVHTPYGTILEQVSVTPGSDSMELQYRISLDSQTRDPDFKDGVKVKYWKVKLLRDSDLLDVTGFNVQHQLTDADNWVTNGGTSTAGRGSMTLDGGYSFYRGQAFTNELLEFNMKTNAGAWPSLVLRAQNSGSDPIGTNNASYLVVIKPEGIELQRFNGGNRTVFYGNIGGAPSLFGDIIPNVAFDYGTEYNLVQLGAMDVDGGVRLLMYINGKLVFDCIDTFEGKIEGNGYFGTYQAGTVIKLSQAPIAVSLNEQIGDSDNWHVTGGAKMSTASGIELNGGFAYYGAETFGDGLLTFNMHTNAGGWPSLLFRTRDGGSDPIGPDNDTYIVVIKPEGIELQRFNGGTRTVFYGNIGGTPSVFGDIIPNTAFDYESPYNQIKLGAMNVDGGVRLLMYINGKLVFDCVDTLENRIEEDGYFGTYQAGNVIKLSPAPVALSLNDVIGDADNWHISGGAKMRTAIGLELNGGFAYYGAKKFGDELLEFNMHTNAGGWPSLLFRTRDGGSDPIGPGNDTYIVVIKPEGIELQRFNGGNRTVFYGNIGGTPSVFGDIIPNTAFDYENPHNRVKLGAVNVEGGVRLLMYINGKLVFDCVDTLEDRIEEDGYFGTYQAGNVIKLSKHFTTGASDGIDFRPHLKTELDNVKQLLDSAEIGDGPGQYPEWAKEYLELVTAVMTVLHENEAATEAELREGIVSLKSAIAVFGKSRNVPENAALNKPTTSSEQGNILVGHGPDKAVDGIVDFSNGWSAESAGGNWPEEDRVEPWLVVDLGSPRIIEAVEVFARPAGTYDGEKKTFQIQASNDPAFGEGSYAVFGGVGTVPFEGESWRLEVTDNTAYRYIRYAKTAIDYAFVSELKVYSARLPEPYSVSGTIRGAAGQTIAGATVELYAFANQQVPVGKTITKEDGSYSISSEHGAGKYWLKATGADGGESAKVIYIPFNHVYADMNLSLEQLAIGPVTFTDAEGNAVDRLIASDFLQASVTVENHQSNPQDVGLIIALFSPSGRLADMAYIEEQVRAFDKVVFRVGLTLPGQIDGYYAKVFIWEGLDSMQPLTDAVLFP